MELPDHNWTPGDDPQACSRCAEDSPDTTDPLIHLYARLARALDL